MRKQRPRGSITREAVVNAALSVTDRDGVERLTIRAVSDVVGAPPMSLYTHFANKNELLDLMYAEISRRMYAYEGHATWQGELLALCHRVRALLTEHPRWVALLARPAPPLAVPLRESILSLMVSDGMTASDALMGLSSAVLATIGLVLVDQALTKPDGGSTIDERFERLKKWVKTPAARGNAETLSALSKHDTLARDYLFQFFASALVAGLEKKRFRPENH
jgi:AcrR family transcriptional regulator